MIPPSARGTRGGADASSPRGGSIVRDDLTLGILAGGRATRLDGRDKAWLERAGVPQVVRVARRFADEVGAVLVSANAGPARYRDAGLDAVADRIADIGPLGGLEALAAHCATPWLLTLPVDIVDANDCLPRTLARAGGDGAVARDDDGPQPLVALYRVDALRIAIASSLASANHSVQAMQAAMLLPIVAFAGFRFGNLNTPGDLRLAGYADD